MVVYLVTSFARMHLGFNYPSDCILSLPVIIVVIGAAHILREIESAFGCQDMCNTDEIEYDVCYADKALGILPLTFGNFYLSTLITPSTIVFFAVSLLVFIGLTSHPIEFWRKTPYMFGNIMGIYLFHNILLCPRASNSKLSLALLTENTLFDSMGLTIVAYTYLTFSFIASLIVLNALLGRRTGHFLSIILRTLFYIVNIL